MVGILLYRRPRWCAGYGRLLLLLGGALVAGGCGKGVGDVTGKVIYKGTPVAMGSVVLAGSDGIPHTGPIEEDGTYAVSDVPAETVKVGVLSPDPGPPLRPESLPPSLAPLAQREIKGPKAEDARRLQAKMQEVRGIKVDTGSSRGDRKKWRRLPKKYEDPNASGLAIEVKKGENTQDIILE
jgi:hypothetical protein